MSGAPGSRRGSGNPAPRPALRKAADADVHPAVPPGTREAVVPLHGTTADAVRTTGEIPRVVGVPTAPRPQPARPAPPAPAAAPAADPVPVPLPEATPIAVPPRDTGVSGDLRGRRGAVTSDSLRRRKEKQVDLKVSVPKSVRQELRAQAKSEGRSVDEFVTAALREVLSRVRTR